MPKKKESKTTQVVLPTKQEVAVSELRKSLPESIEERWNFAHHNHHLAGVAIAKAGAALLTLHADLPRGEFAKGLEDKGISPGTAYRMMKVARNFPTLEKLFKIGPSKIYALAEAGLSEEDYDAEADTIDGESIDDIARLSVRELKQKLRKSKKESAAMKADIDDAEVRIAELEEQVTAVPGNVKKAQEIFALIRLAGASVIGLVERINIKKEKNERILQGLRDSLISAAMEIHVEIDALNQHPKFAGIPINDEDVTTISTWLEQNKLDIKKFCDN